MDWDRAPARRGRRLLVDRAERDRPRTCALRARGPRARHHRRRARLRPGPGGVPLLGARRETLPRLGEDDRAPLPVRAGGRAATGAAEAVGRRRARRARREDRPRGDLPPHARADVVRPPEGRATLHRGARRAATAARRGSRGALTGADGTLGGDDDGAPLATGRDEVVTAEQVWDALAEIPDPEIPVISLVDLGVIRDVGVEDGTVRVDFTPTFLGCPALEVMRDAMVERIRALGAEPTITVRTDDSWSTDRITPTGREKLRAAGFAPPAPREAAAPTLVQLQSNAFRFPYCGSTDTRLDNIFGPTPCRSVRYCASCRQPFEQFKTI